MRPASSRPVNSSVYNSTPTSSAFADVPIDPPRAVNLTLSAKTFRSLLGKASKMEPEAVSLASLREYTVSTSKSPVCTMSTLPAARATKEAPGFIARFNGKEIAGLTPSDGM